VTISFAGVISLVSVNWIELTNGPLGLPGVPAPDLGPWSLRTKAAFYYLVLAAVALSYAVCRRLVCSRIGRAFVALRENEPLAESIGVDVTHYLVLAAVVSAAMAGLAGSLRALHALREPGGRSEEHTSELQSRSDLVCRLLLEKKKKEKK